MTFPSSGDDSDIVEAYRQAKVDGSTQHAQSLLALAQAMMDDVPSEGDVQQAERNARQALESLASALNWAEDSASEAEAHLRMDDAGRWVRETFGCQLHQEDNRYSQTCPVALGHNRIGMSVGGVATRTCSLCGVDLSECEHRKGTAYLVPGGSQDLGWCRVCLAEEGCDHSADQTYRVSVIAIIREMVLDEVSLVGKPSHPDARLRSVGIRTSELQEALGPEFTPGIPVNCDLCLLPCEGLRKHNAGHF